MKPLIPQLFSVISVVLVDTFSCFTLYFTSYLIGVIFDPLPPWLCGEERCRGPFVESKVLSSDFNPLIDPVPVEVPLENAPLARVLSQVRFPLIASVGQQDFIAPFQEALRGQYPILRDDSNQSVSFERTGEVSTRSERIWRFLDADEDWRVTLASGFVAIETSRYESRSDFLERFGFVLAAMETHIAPAHVDRVGMRYVDRVIGEDYPKLSSFVRKEILGILGHPLIEKASHSLCETAFELPDEKASLVTRWGRIPSHRGIDANIVGPIKEPSWILDLDMFSEEKRAFGADSLSLLLGGYMERLYAFFRWVVTDDFLRHYGGEL